MSYYIQFSVRATADKCTVFQVERNSVGDDYINLNLTLERS